MDKFLIKRKKELEKDNVTPSTSIADNDTVVMKKIRKGYTFNDRWLNLPEFKQWLVSSEDEKGQILPKCRLCNIMLTNHKPALNRHAETAKHKSMISSVSHTKPIEKALQRDPIDEMCKRGELKIAAMLATNNLPFSLCDTLVPLIADICPDSKIAQKMTMGRTKATAVVNQILGPTLSENELKKLQEPGSFFAVIMDETTDQGSVKQCAITAIVNDADFVRTKFFDMVEMPSGTAEDLFSALISAIKIKNIPLSNLVGFPSDTTNTMVGQYNSVFAKLKEEIPGILCVKCSCHMIHLVSSKACLKLPKSVEDMLRNIGSHFSRSYGRQKKLEEMQVFFKTEIHKILSPANTRWLSLKQCVDRVLEQYPALKAYFAVEVFEDPSQTTESILSALNDNFTQLYLEFMSYALELLNDFNTLFQSEIPLLHKLQPEIERLIKTICMNYIEFNHSKTNNAYDIDYTNPRRFVSIEKLYLGPNAHTTLTELKSSPNPPDDADILKFQTNCLSFYIEIIREIKKRFNFSDPIFKEISILNPETAQSFGTKDLNGIVQRFPILQDYIDVNLLNKEWRDHALLQHNEIGLHNTLPAEEYWRKLFKLARPTGEPLFPNLRKVINLLLILPFSNASVERVFSKLKRIKTENRNRLNTNTVVSLMHVNQGIALAGGLKMFEPTKAMLNKSIKY